MLFFTISWEYFLVLNELASIWIYCEHVFYIYFVVIGKYENIWLLKLMVRMQTFFLFMFTFYFIYSFVYFICVVDLSGGLLLTIQANDLQNKTKCKWLFIRKFTDVNDYC